MKIFVLCLSLLLTACTPSLPDQEREISAFIPESAVEKPTEILDFSLHFPDDCEWVSLERVVDGDTIKIAGDVSVRFLGIDTPETVHPTKPIQPWGPEASAAVTEILQDDERVCLLPDPLSDTLDEYGRRLAYVFDSDGTDLSAALLRQGLARGFFRFPLERQAEFKMLQSQAKEAKVGIWSD